MSKRCTTEDTTVTDVSSVQMFTHSLGQCLESKSNPITALDRPLGFQEVEVIDNRHMKVVRLSALRTGRLYPPRKYSWYSFLLEAESTFV
jgi:hypothetical protein